MEIIIDQNKRLSAIQAEFQKHFPFLKLEFYKDMHTAGQGSAKDATLNINLTIADVQKNKASGILKIHGLMTVAELESGFANIFGLSAQVFKKSGRIWLQTTVSDHWTLAEQNHHAIENEENASAESIDAMDRMELE